MPRTPLQIAVAVSTAPRRSEEQRSNTMAGNGNRRQLRDLHRALTDEVAAQDLVIPAVHHELIEPSIRHRR